MSRPDIGRADRIMYEIHHGRLFENTTYRLYFYAERHRGWHALVVHWLGDRLDDLGVLWTTLRSGAWL